MPDRQRTTRRNRESTVIRIATPIDMRVPALPPVLTVDEAAIVLSFSRSSVIEAIQRGELPAIRLNNRYRIPTAKLKQIFDRAEDERRRRRQESGLFD